jgi:hypothetical protein
MSKNSQASIFGGFTQNEFDELVRKISNGEPIYQKEPVDDLHGGSESPDDTSCDGGSDND